MVNHSEKKWEFNGKPYICKPGQVVTSLKSISQKCGRGVSQTIVKNAIKRFEKLGILTNDSTKKNRLITICNWDNYQNTDITVTKQPAKESPDTDQTHTKEPPTNKNVKNDKNGKKRKENLSHLTFEEIQALRARDSFETACEELLAKSTG
jgi:DNA replication protein DnaD